MTRNVAKNISAVPKSFITARQPKQNMEKNRNICRFFFSYSSSSVAEPMKMKAIFTSSDGCIEYPPSVTQIVAPLRAFPNTTLKRNSPTLMTRSGFLSLTPRWRFLR